MIVDIEYNRYYENPKMLDTIEGRITARPDIIVHSRMNKDFPTQHFLVVEAKKDNISNHDINKIKGFINDDDYTYLFGLTISYCQNQNNVIGILFWWQCYCRRKYFKTKELETRLKWKTFSFILIKCD